MAFETRMGLGLGQGLGARRWGDGGSGLQRGSLSSEFSPSTCTHTCTITHAVWLCT